MRLERGRGGKVGTPPQKTLLKKEARAREKNSSRWAYLLTDRRDSRQPGSLKEGLYTGGRCGNPGRRRSADFQRRRRSGQTGRWSPSKLSEKRKGHGWWGRQKSRVSNAHHVGERAQARKKGMAGAAKNQSWAGEKEGDARM